MLGLAVATTAGLTWETIQSSRSAARTMQSVLRDYATFAAWQFAREARQHLDANGTIAIDFVRHHLVERPGSHPEPDCDCEPSRWFVKQFHWQSAEAVPGGPPELEPLLADARTALADPSARPGRRIVIVGRGDAARVAVWHLQGGLNRGVVATIAEPAYLRTLFDGFLATSPLLPETLVDAGARDAFGIVVESPMGDRIYTSGAGSPIVGDTVSLPEQLGSLRVTASIAGDRASSLVIGGAPTARWPLALTLLGVSVGLVALGVIQMRREVLFARRQSDFVSGVSHELRTPLAQIRLFGETLLLGRVRTPEEGRRAAEVIVQEARRLSGLVDTVLLFSRLERQALSLVREHAHLPGLLADVVQSFRPFADARQARIDCAAPADDPPRAVDVGVVRQIVLNLLDNAVKYGPHGQTIRVRLTGSARVVTIEVEDEGPGVALEEEARIWEPFWRAPGSAEGGSGLGLAIVRDLARRHGGEATVSRGDHGGARFAVRLDAPVAT